MAAKQFFLPYQAATINAVAEPGATLTFYTTGTLTKLPVYTTSALTTTQTNPVEANGAGRFPDIYLNDTLTYRLIIKDRNGATLDDFDPFIPGTVIGFSSDVATLTVNVTDFGAQCDTSKLGVGGTDDTAAVQLAIDYVAALGGGEILVPGHTKCAGSLSLASLSNIVIRGPSGSGAGYNAPPPAQLIYTGAGSSPFISAPHSLAIELREIGVRYTSASFTGDLIAFTNLTVASDAAYCLVERCLVGGIGVATARSLISLEGAILCSVVDNHLQWGVVGVRGRKEVAVGNVLYSNAHYIGRNTFDNLTTSALLNAGEGWTVIGNWFEGTNGGSGGMPRAYYDNISAASAASTSAMTWAGNWCGDAVAVTDAWFRNGFTRMRGLSISGGLFDTAGSSVPGVKLSADCQGVSISGTTMSGAIDLGSIAHVGVTITGNFLGAAVANHASVQNLVSLGNQVNGGSVQDRMRLGDVREFGYGAGAGGTVTQITSRATAVTLNKLSGQIVLFNAAGSAAWSAFSVNNSLVKLNDTIHVCQQHDGSSDTYICHARAHAGSFDLIFATTGGTTTETIVFNFTVISGSAS